MKRERESRGEFTLLSARAAHTPNGIKRVMQEPVVVVVYIAVVEGPFHPDALVTCRFCYITLYIYVTTGLYSATM